MNQGPFVHSENDCLHAVGENISSAVRRCLAGRRAGGRHLEPFRFEADAEGDGGEQGHLKRMQKMMMWLALGV